MTFLLTLIRIFAIRLMICAAIAASYNFYASLRYGFEKRSLLCDKLLLICFPVGGCLSGWYFAFLHHSPFSFLYIALFLGTAASVFVAVHVIMRIFKKEAS